MSLHFEKKEKIVIISDQILNRKSCYIREMTTYIIGVPSGSMSCNTIWLGTRKTLRKGKIFSAINNYNKKIEIPLSINKEISWWLS